MNDGLLSNKQFALLFAILMIPVLIIVLLSFSSGESIYHISFEGFKEIFSSLRLNELLKICIRSLVVSITATTIAYLIAYFLVLNASYSFQSIYLVLISLPFLANESIRVYSWQLLLSEDGLFNNILSEFGSIEVTFFNGTNIVNIYLVMIIACIPFGIFINSAALKMIPKIYWKSAEDLNLNAVNKFWKVGLPLSKSAVIVSFIVTFFISFSLYSEVAYLGGDSKISLRNLISSLMSASKFQSIFCLGFIITFSLVAFILLSKLLIGNKTLS